MFDLYSAHHIEVMERTRQEVNRLCQQEGLRRPYICAVAMLAGMPAPGAGCALGSGSAEDPIAGMARLAADASLDGVITSPRQVSAIRAACGRRVMIVTFAVSAADGWRDNGVGPAQAVRSGADYLMVGKPLWNAADPLRVIREVLYEMDRGVRSAQRGSLALVSERPSIN